MAGVFIAIAILRVPIAAVVLTPQCLVFVLAAGVIATLVAFAFGDLPAGLRKGRQDQDQDVKETAHYTQEYEQRNVSDHAAAAA